MIASHVKLLSGLTLVSTIVAFTSCGRDDVPAGFNQLTSDDASADYVDSVPQLLSQANLSKYKAALPKIAYQKIQDIFADPNTRWYDKEVMTPSYQDSVAPDVTVGCRKNRSGPGLINIIPGGRQIFSDDGQTFNFPFGHTAGTDDSNNIHVVDFLWLPVVN